MQAYITPSHFNEFQNKKLSTNEAIVTLDKTTYIQTKKKWVSFYISQQESTTTQFCHVTENVM
jgi:hypothetical protein